MAIDNSQIKKELANEFSSIFSNLIDDEIKVKREKGISFYEKDIVEKIGISPNSFRYYKNGNTGEDENSMTKIPDLVALYKIKNYFNVPYSYLLGETKVKEINNINLGISLGLDDLVINKLKKLKENENSNNSKMLLFIINSLIGNDKFILKFGQVLYSNMARKYSNLEDDFYTYNREPETLEYEKFQLSLLVSQVIEEISNRDDIPSDIIECLK